MGSHYNNVILAISYANNAPGYSPYDVYHNTGQSFPLSTTSTIPVHLFYLNTTPAIPGLPSNTHQAYLTHNYSSQTLSLLVQLRLFLYLK